MGSGAACGVDAVLDFSCCVLQQAARLRGKQVAHEFGFPRFEELPPVQPGWLTSLIEQEFALFSSAPKSNDAAAALAGTAYPPPTEGMSVSFLDFPTKERLLLTALWQKGNVRIEAVLRAVWGSAPPREPEDTLHKLKTRTNKRLAAKSHNVEIRREGKTLKLSRL